MLVKAIALASLLYGAQAGCPFAHLHNPDLPNIHATPKDGCSAPELKKIKSSVDPNPGQTTVHGCTCTSSCGATPDFGSANCDWCYTANKCGHYAYTRLAYYDYCVYPKNNTYEGKSWDQKLDILWNAVVANPGMGSYPNVLNMLGESIQTSFDNHHDTMPNGRIKYIHSVGAVCKFSLMISPDSPFTGVFGPGQINYGLIRMGSAVPVTSKVSMTPGIGVKILRTGIPSANWVVLRSLDAQESHDFFNTTQSNHIDPPTGVTAVLGVKFGQASNCITQVGLSDAARWTQAGDHIESPKFPYEIIWTPTHAVNTNGATTTEALVHMLETIPIGTQLYRVSVYETPWDKYNGKPTELGVVATASECRGSKFGDNVLFFKHQRMEDDWALRPEWVKDIRPQEECGASEVDPVPPRKCEDLTDAHHDEEI